MESALTNATLDLLQAAIGADTVSFAGSKVHLISEDFTPTPDLDRGTLSTINGSGIVPLTVNGTSLNTSIDSVTGDRRADAMPPVGGWRWETNEIPGTALTAYGVLWEKGSEAVGLKYWKFDNPVVFNAANQSYLFPIPVGFAILPQGIQ